MDRILFDHAQLHAHVGLASYCLLSATVSSENDPKLDEAAKRVRVAKCTGALRSASVVGVTAVSWSMWWCVGGVWVDVCGRGETGGGQWSRRGLWGRTAAAVEGGRFYLSKG